MRIHTFLLSTTLVMMTGLAPALAQSSSSDAMAKAAGAMDSGKLAGTLQQIGADGSTSPDAALAAPQSTSPYPNN